jgi:hypothetical protein
MPIPYEIFEIDWIVAVLRHKYRIEKTIVMNSLHPYSTILSPWLGVKEECLAFSKPIMQTQQEKQKI